MISAYWIAAVPPLMGVAYCFGMYRAAKFAIDIMKGDHK